MSSQSWEKVADGQVVRIDGHRQRNQPSRFALVGSVVALSLLLLVRLWDATFGGGAAVLELLVPRLESYGGVDDFVAIERQLALQSVLNNIGPNGSLVQGAGAFVIASPSKQDPDYFFTWSRDSALTMQMIIDEFMFSNEALLPYIEDYIHSQAVLQTVTNPSGSLLPDGVGLGEPKYTASGKRFNEPWGRPQRDGPALRAIALITYSEWLISKGKSNEAKSIVWPVISNDISYVGQYWNQTGFDLWEEVNGSSFFTVQNQHRALEQATRLAKKLEVSCSSCEQAPEVLCFLQSFWNGQYLVANTNTNTVRSGLDANTILGSISVFDVDADCNSLTFQPCNSKSLSNFKYLMDSFRREYSLNTGLPIDQGVAVGRYAEDVYFNGNPWYLTTLAAAEFLYDAVAQWNSHGFINIDSTSLPFFQDIYPAATAGQHINSTAESTFSKIATAITAYADSFVAIAQKYTPPDGSLAEQFDRNTGAPLSATHLTWSYASVITMSQRRSGQYPPSWQTRDNRSPPQTCSASSTPGTYIPAVAAGAPSVNSSCTVPMRFAVNATTYYGENVFVSGDDDEELGGWDGANALPLNAAGYTAEWPLWTADVRLTAGKEVRYRFLRKEDCGRLLYETVNRTVVVPACGTVGGGRTDDAWTGPVGVRC